MVDIIPKVPTFGERIGGSFGRGAGKGFSEALETKERHRQLMKENEEIFRETGIKLGSLDPEMRKQEFIEQLRGKNQLGLENEKGENARKLQGLKKNPKEDESTELKNIAQSAFNEMVPLINDLGRGSGVLGFFGGDTAKKSGKFTSLTGALEAILVDKVSRGTLSNARFQYITQTLLPKPTDTQDEIRGKMEGLAEILDLDPSALTGNTKSKSSQANMENKPSLEDIFG